LRALLRIRRSADFVFGINSFVFAKEPEKLSQRARMSTPKNPLRALLLGGGLFF